jgi:hypothetical protein
MWRMSETNKDLIKLVSVLILVALLHTGCAKPRSSPTCRVSDASGGALIQCPDGSSEFVSDGARGEQGQQGNQGPQGNAGANGQDATPVVPVQLCPNVTPTYASVFPEYALCISGHLYGTYNQKTSYQYLAELPDGAYSSDGQGAACSFTITGCTIAY